MKTIEHAVKMTNEYIEQMPKSLRKKYGQFFTSKETAIFMAYLFKLPEEKKEISILDPGAGSGILSIALIDRLQEEATLEHISLVCYENDMNVVDLLKSNLEWACKNSEIRISYQIISDNYILSQMPEYNNALGSNPTPEKYDLIIGNPPYMKIPKNAPEALAMPDICYGAPNLYFLFTTMSLFNLNKDGEMVFIIPRSWTSGAYFRKFREKLLAEGALEHIHLFVSRDKVFEKESVLQETIIIKIKKTREKPKDVIVTSTRTNHDFSDITEFNAPYCVVVSGEASYVYLVTGEEEVDTLNVLNKWKDTLPTLGLKMKTGLTVDFRNRELLREKAGEEIVPLFYAQHIKDGKVIFPIGKEYEYISTEKKGTLQKNTNYLFVKRFTAKEEHRRLQCGIYLARENNKYKQISTQNKLNFISGTNDLSEELVCGLYVLFNSTLYDRYYRILNGSTQVNSTEVNTMPVPPLSSIEIMGKEIIKRDNLSELTCDEILRRYI